MVPMTMLICVTPPAITPGMPSRDQAAHAVGHARPAQLQPDVVAPQAVHQQPELQDAGDEHAPRLHDAGHRLVAVAERHADERRQPS